uniref:Leukotriene B4 receptor 2 n=2 Tax=Latimeria chalumnae TaxID=7897 RepID=H3AR62_LATCH
STDFITTTYDPETVVSSIGSIAIGSIILTLALFIGLPGNCFIIWSILCKLRKRSVTSILILNLAVADGVVLMLTPFFITFLAMRGWVFGEVICKMVYYICCFSMYTSIMIIMLMGVDRYVAVAKPYVAQSIRKKKLVRKILFGIWFLSFLLALPPLFYRKVQKDEVEGMNMSICRNFHKSDGHKIFHYTFETVLSFIIPLIVITFSYSNIARRLKNTRFRRRVRMEKIIIIIMVAFALLWVPYHIVNILEVFACLAEEDLKNKLNDIAKSLRAAVTALAFVSSGINPLLYTFAGTGFIKTSGLGFIAKMFDGSASELSAKFSRSNKDLSRELSKIEPVELSETLNGVNQ